MLPNNALERAVRDKSTGETACVFAAHAHATRRTGRQPAAQRRR
jgi:hypothetical protein